jgi:hypothetical protein
MENKTGIPMLNKAISWIAIAGNIIFILWILVNGIMEGFEGTVVEKFSYLLLIVLLGTNAFLLFQNNRK